MDSQISGVKNSATNSEVGVKRQASNQSPIKEKKPRLPHIDSKQSLPIHSTEESSIADIPQKRQSSIDPVLEKNSKHIRRQANEDYNSLNVSPSIQRLIDNSGNKAIIGQSGSQN